MSQEIRAFLCKQKSIEGLPTWDIDASPLRARSILPLAVQ
jgi:hypothetical protein